MKNIIIEGVGGLLGMICFFSGLFVAFVPFAWFLVYSPILIIYLCVKYWNAERGQIKYAFTYSEIGKVAWTPLVLWINMVAIICVGLIRWHENRV